MIEVPEYLLARSRQRRQELSGEPAADAAPQTPGSEVAAAAAAATSPAKPVAVAAVAVAAGEAAVPEVPKVVPPYITAAIHRKKMPVWAASVMVFLPIWAIFYVGMLEPPSSDELDLAGNGAVVYSTCASCHGSDGAGSATGRQLNDGELLLTFPATPDNWGLAQHLSWVYLGTEGTRSLGTDNYGNPDRPDGQRRVGSFASGMSGFSNLDLDDLVSVVYYERLTHGQLEPERAELEEMLLLALAEDDVTFETGSPDEISGLLSAAAEGHGVESALGE